jgi:hypothetical protein
MTDGVCPATEGVGVMTIIDVCTSVTGGAEDAVKTDVAAAGGGRFELAGGAADDCAGGGALEAGGGGCEEGGSAEDGGLEGAGAAEDGAGAAEGTASRVTDGDGGEEASAEGAGADSDAGLEGRAKEESNVLAVPLLDMATTIAVRKSSQEMSDTEGSQAATTTTTDNGATTEKQCHRDWFQCVRKLVSVVECGQQRLGNGAGMKARMRGDLGASPPVDPWAE